MEPPGISASRLHAIRTPGDGINGGRRAAEPAGHLDAGIAGLGHSPDRRHGDQYVERGYSCRTHDRGRCRLGSGAEGVARHLPVRARWCSRRLAGWVWVPGSPPLAVARQDTLHSALLCRLESDDGMLGCSSDLCRYGAERGSSYLTSAVDTYDWRWSGVDPGAGKQGPRWTATDRILQRCVRSRRHVWLATSAGAPWVKMDTADPTPRCRGIWNRHGSTSFRMAFRAAENCAAFHGYGIWLRVR